MHDILKIKNKEKERWYGQGQGGEDKGVKREQDILALIKDLGAQRKRLGKQEDEDQKQSEQAYKAIEMHNFRMRWKPRSDDAFQRIRFTKTQKRDITEDLHWDLGNAKKR
jgi:hypothetical protein